MIWTGSRRIADRLWRSETLMTWGSFASRFVSLILLLPIILRNLSLAEFAVFQSFQLATAFQLALFRGMEPNFVRMLAAVMGGARRVDSTLVGQPPVSAGGRDEHLLARLIGTIHVAYLVLAVFLILMFLILGLAVMPRTFGLLDEPGQGWMAWFVLASGTALTFYGTCYNCYLQGMGQLVLARRLEAVTVLVSVLLSSLVVSLGGRLLELVLSQQAVLGLGIIVRQRITRRLLLRPLNSPSLFRSDRNLLKTAFSFSWKVGVGAFLHDGIFGMALLLYARMLSAELAAPFLLATRMISVLVEFSLAPLYSKLPRMASLMAAGRLGEVLRVGRRGMGISFVSYGVGCIGVGLLGNTLLAWIGSNTPFASPDIWLLLSWAFLVERYSAMHLSLYTVSNTIIWHRAYVASSLVFVASMLLLPPGVGLATYPLAVLISELTCNAWWLPHRSRNMLKTRFLEFEKGAFLPGLVIMILWTAVTLQTQLR